MSQTSSFPNLKEFFRGDIEGSQFLPSHTGSKTTEADLDLSRMARSALHYLRHNPEPSRAYECKFSLGPLGIPCHVPMCGSNQYGYDPVSLGDTDCRMHWQYSHMRRMAGETAPDDIELGVQKRVLSYLRSDNLAWINPTAYIGEPIDGEWVGTWTTAKLLYSLSELYQTTGEKALRGKAKNVLKALRGLALWKDNLPFYRGIAPYKNGEWLMRGWCEHHAHNYPFIVEPLVRYWECTGDEEGLELATQFAEGFLHQIQPDMAEKRIDPLTGAYGGHVHTHTHAIWGVAHLGALTGRKDFLHWVENAFKFTLTQGTDYGWSPEYLPGESYKSETCVVGDMVSIASWLARGLSPDYWGYVDRTVRNQLRRSQFFLTDAFVEFYRHTHRHKDAETVEEALKELSLLEGGFIAQTDLNDWISATDPTLFGSPGLFINGIQMMGCCPPEGMRGIYEAWLGCVEEKGAEIYINLLFDHDHDAVKIEHSSAQPGHATLGIRRHGNYRVRVPEWVHPDELVAKCNGTQIGLPPEGKSYLHLDSLHPGDFVELNWPVPIFTQTFTPLGVVEDKRQTITVSWVGNDVLNVTPIGQYLPMYSTPLSTLSPT